VSDTTHSGDKSVTPRFTDDARTARLARETDGDPLGAAVFLTDDDLRKLGVDLVDADRVAYVVADGDLALDAEGSTNSES
jgi:hypothetical protein